MSIEKGSQGFASMDPARRRKISQQGGRAAHEQRTAHEWTPDEARRAGRKGGLAKKHKKAQTAA
jgi:general stress protein YciG